MKEMHYNYFKSSVENILKNKILLSFLFILEYFFFGINMFLTNYYLLNYSKPFIEYKQSIPILSISVIHNYHSIFKDCRLHIVIPFIVFILFIIISVLSHVKSIPKKMTIIFINIFEFLICRLFFIFICDIFSNQLIYFGKHLSKGPLHIFSFIFFFIIIVIYSIFTFLHITVHCSLCCFAVDYCFDFASRQFEKCLLIIKVLITININMLDIKSSDNGNDYHLYCLNVIILVIVFVVTLFYTYSLYNKSVIYIHNLLYTKIRLLFLLSITTQSITFLVFPNHNEEMYIILCCCIFLVCIVVTVNYDPISLFLKKKNFDDAFENLLFTLHLIDPLTKQSHRIIYIKNIRYHFIFCKRCFLCKKIMNEMMTKTVSVTNKEEVCQVIDTYHAIFMKEIEHKVRQRTFQRFYYDLICLINLTRKQKGFNFKVQYMCHKLVERYYKEDNITKYLNLKHIFLNFSTLNSLKESSKFKLIEDTFYLTHKVVEVIHSIKQIIKGKFKSSRDFITLSNQLRMLRSKEIKKFLSNRENMQSYPVVLIRLVIEDMLSIPIKKEEGLLRKEKNYSEEFLDFHFVNDRNMVIEVALQRNSFIIRKAGNELIKYVNHEIAKIFPSKIKKCGIDNLKELINSSERKKIFSFVINVQLPKNNNTVIRSKHYNRKKSTNNSFASSESGYSCNEERLNKNTHVLTDNENMDDDDLNYYLFDYYFSVSPGFNNSDLSLIGEYVIHKNELLITQINDNSQNVYSTGIGGGELGSNSIDINGNTTNRNIHNSTIIMGDLLLLKEISKAIVYSIRHKNAYSTKDTNINETNKVKTTTTTNVNSNAINDNEFICYVSKSFFSSSKIENIRNIKEFKKLYERSSSSTIITSPRKYDKGNLGIHYNNPNSAVKSSGNFLLPCSYPIVRRPRISMNSSTIIVPNNKHIFNELEMHNKKPVVSHNDTLNVVFNPYRYKVNTLQHYFTKKDKDGNYTIKKDKEDYSLRLQLIIKPSKKIYKVYLFLKQTSNLIYSKPKSQIFEFGSTLQLIQNEAVKHDETKTGTVERTMYGDNLGNFIDCSSSVNTLSSSTTVLSIKLNDKEEKTFKTETEREQRLLIYKNRFHTFTVIILMFSFFIIVINVFSLIVNFYLNAEFIDVNNIYSDSKETNRLFYSLLSSFFSTMCVGFPKSSKCVNYLYEKCTKDKEKFQLTTNMFKYVKLENEKKLNEMIRLTQKLKRHIYKLNSQSLDQIFNIDFEYTLFGVVNNKPSFTFTKTSFSHALEMLCNSLNAILNYPNYSSEPIYIITAIELDMSNIHNLHSIKTWQIEYYNTLFNYRTYILTFEHIQTGLYMRVTNQMTIYIFISFMFLVMNYFLHLILFGLLSGYLKSFHTLVKMDINAIIKKTKDKTCYKFYIKKFNILLTLAKFYEDNPNHLIYKLDSLLKNRVNNFQKKGTLNNMRMNTGENKKNVYIDNSILLINGQLAEDYKSDNEKSSILNNDRTLNKKNTNYQQSAASNFINELNIPVSNQLFLIIYIFLLYYSTFFVVFIVIWEGAISETRAKIQMVQTVTGAEYSTYNDFTLIQIMFLANMTETELSNSLRNNTDPYFLSNDIHKAMKIGYIYERINSIHDHIMPLLETEFRLNCDNFYKEVQDQKLIAIDKENPDDQFIANIIQLCKKKDWFSLEEELMVYKHLFYTMYKLIKSFDERDYENIMQKLNDEKIFTIYYYEYFVIRFMCTWYNSVVYKEEIDNSTKKETTILIVYLVIEVFSEIGLFLVLSKYFFNAIKQTNDNLTLLTRAFFNQ